MASRRFLLAAAGLLVVPGCLSNAPERSSTRTVTDGGERTPEAPATEGETPSAPPATAIALDLSVDGADRMDALRQGNSGTDVSTRPAHVEYEWLRYRDRAYPTFFAHYDGMEQVLRATPVSVSSETETRALESLSAERREFVSDAIAQPVEEIPENVDVDQYVSTDGQVYAIWTEKRRYGGYELYIDTDEAMDASAVAADRTLVALALDEETSAIVRTAVESGEYRGEADPPAQLAAVAEYGTGVWGSGRFRLSFEETDSGFVFGVSSL